MECYSGTFWDAAIAADPAALTVTVKCDNLCYSSLVGGVVQLGCWDNARTDTVQFAGDQVRDCLTWPLPIFALPLGLAPPLS